MGTQANPSKAVNAVLVVLGIAALGVAGAMALGGGGGGGGGGGEGGGEVPYEGPGITPAGTNSQPNAQQVKFATTMSTLQNGGIPVAAIQTKELGKSNGEDISYKAFAWQKNSGKNPKGGLNAKGRASAKKQGHNLKPPVLVAKTLGQMKRQYSFLSRMSGNPGPEYDEKGNPTRLLLSLKVWGASSKITAKKKAKVLKSKIESRENASTKELHSLVEKHLFQAIKVEKLKKLLTNSL